MKIISLAHLLFHSEMVAGLTLASASLPTTTPNGTTSIATEAVKGTINDLIQVLDDETLKQPEQAEEGRMKSMKSSNIGAITAHPSRMPGWSRRETEGDRRQGLRKISDAVILPLTLRHTVSMFCFTVAPGLLDYPENEGPV